VAIEQTISSDTFARNPDNSDNAKSKPLAWRNAWDIPELTKQADAAALERDGADPVFLGGSEFVQFFVRDLDKYIKLVKQAGVKAEQ
jgi:hypothetical protein